MSDEKVEGEGVRKLDDPEQFNAIKTNLKTTSGLKEHESAKYETWFNQLQESNPSILPRTKGSLKWIADNHEILKQHIYDTYISMAPNTLRNHLESLANILLAIDKVKFKEVARPLFNTGLKIQQAVDEENRNSVLSEKELANFVTYDELVKKRDEIQKEWLENPKDIRLNMFHMILAINTYIPPLRLTWLEMNIYPPRLVNGAIVKPAITGTPPPENRANYLWEHAPGQWTLIIGEDKIENARQKKKKSRQMIPLSDEIPGVTNGHRLNELMNISISAQPRNYVLIGIKQQGQHMVASSYSNALAKMFAPKKPTQTVLRKAYVCHWHSQGLSFNILNKIADRMRHTLYVALASYWKTNTPAVVAARAAEAQQSRSSSSSSSSSSAAVHEIKEQKLPELATLPIVPPSEVSRLPRVLPTPAVPPTVLPSRNYFQPVEYARKYREKHHVEILRKQRDKYAEDSAAVLRYKILYGLNRGLSTRPQAATIAKYALYQDSHTGKWKSRQLERPEEKDE